MRIGIIVDNPRRDLKGCCLIAEEAIKRGHEAVLIPLYSQGYEVPLLRLDAIIVNYLRKNNSELIRYYKNMGIKVFVLDTEAGLLSSDGPRSPQGWAEFVSENKLTDLIDGYFFWGVALYEGFKKFGNLSLDKLKVTGAPRYDLTNPRYRKLLDAKEKGFILVNTNFAGINPKFGKTPEYEVKTSLAAGVDEILVRNIIRDQKIIMTGLIESVIKISKILPHKNFVLRPHPFEGETIYREAFQNLGNVRVDGTGEIFDALQGASALVHVNCTTAIDAYFLDVPSISAEYLNTELMANYMRIPSLISVSAMSEEDVVDCINNPQLLEQQKIKYNENSALVDSMFGARDGKSSERIIDFIENKNFSKNIKVSLLESVTGSESGKGIKRMLEGLLNHIIGGHQVAKIRVLLNPVRADKQLRLEEVAEIFQKTEAAEQVKVSYSSYLHKLHSIVVQKR